MLMSVVKYKAAVNKKKSNWKMKKIKKIIHTHEKKLKLTNIKILKVIS